ncbi:MAG TPA: CsgG/HfaB family protein [Acetobacteraceae bacterium]|nr:CsgG/HfaB family protein [Acetobacteraceae bacterium]
MGYPPVEQARAAGGMVTTNTPSKVGGFEGIDNLVYGTITSVSAKRSGDVGSTLMAGLLGQRDAHCTAVKATLALDIKITDSRTGEIRYATHIDDSQKSVPNCSGNEKIDTAALMRSAADKVANGLTNCIYPIQIAMAAPDGSLVQLWRGHRDAGGADGGLFQGRSDPRSGLGRHHRQHRNQARADPRERCGGAHVEGHACHGVQHDAPGGLDRAPRKRRGCQGAR